MESLNETPESLKETSPAKCALYARVSTRDKGQNPETQLLPLRDFARARGYEVVGEYVDVGISGAKASRPQLDRLMRDVRRGTVGAVLVARFDRFARSVSHLLRALEEFRQHHVDFISLNESIDTSTPLGKLVFTILGAVAEMERALIQERVKAGVDRARRQGKKLGRPRKEVDLETVHRLQSQGCSMREIARRMGIPRASIPCPPKLADKPMRD